MPISSYRQQDSVVTLDRIAQKAAYDYPKRLLEAVSLVVGVKPGLCLE